MRSISLIRALFVGALLLTVCIEALGVTGREVGARYLVITHDNFYESILPLAQWKHKKGMMAKVVKLSEIGYTAPEIRAYIDDAYLYWQVRPEYLLLVGDTEFLPTYHGLSYTDNYYGDMENDYLAEIVVGRFSVDTPSHCETMVSKTLGYERTPYLAYPYWFEKATLIVRDDFDSGDSIYYDDTWYIYNLMVDGGYAWVDTFFRKDGSSASDVISAIDNGRAFVNYRGQGVSNWWSPFLVDPYSTNNGFRLPVVISGTCGTGSFHDDGFVCEDWVRAGTSGNPRGAVGFFGTSTIGSGPGLSQLRGAVDQGFFKSVLLDSVLTLGGVCLGGKFNLYQLYNNQWEYEGWNLLGDPELNLWTSTPETLEVNHPSSILAIPSDFTVAVFRDTYPVREALVCVAMDTSVYEYGYTDWTGQVTFSIAPTSPGTLSVTVTARNCLPYEGECWVQQSPDPYLVYKSHHVDDDSLGLSQGNGDGNVNSGERIEFGIWMENIGLGDAFGVYGLLSTADTFCTVLQDSGYFGDIASGDTVCSQTEYLFDVRSDCPDGYFIGFDLSCTDEPGSTWVSSLGVTVGSALIVYWSHTIDDAGQLCPNGGLDQGESAWMEVEIRNQGYGCACAVVGSLATEDSFVTVCDSRGWYGDIFGQERVSNSLDRFIIRADPWTPWGHEVGLILHLTGLHNFSETLSFTLRVGGAGGGVVGPDNYGYYAYDDTDIQFTECPIYDWVEISGVGTPLSLNDDTTVTLPLPFGFKYYGLDYTQVSICSNGFQAMGSTSSAPWGNEPLPSTSLPPAGVCPFWDDLWPSEGDSGGGTVYCYSDPLNHRWIMEYQEVEHWPSGSPETFEVILYDPLYDTTQTGDGEIIFQYDSLSNPSSSTIGIQDHTRTIALQYAYNSSYDLNAVPLQPGRAIKFTTDPPVLVEGPCIQYEEHTIYDPAPGGNNNGIVEPGEWVEMVVVLANSGTGGATGVQGTLRTEDPDVTIGDSTGAFGDIPVGGQGDNNSDRFAFSVVDSVQDDVVEFELYAIADGGYQTISPFTIYIGPVGAEELTSYRLLVKSYRLQQNYPNPFTTLTTVQFSVPAGFGDQHVSLRLYDISGRLIRTLFDEVLTTDRLPLTTALSWDGRNDRGEELGSGVYFLRISMGDFRKTRKMVLVR